MEYVYIRQRQIEGWKLCLSVNGLRFVTAATPKYSSGHVAVFLNV